jgi:hypothetical protein
LSRSSTALTVAVLLALTGSSVARADAPIVYGAPGSFWRTPLTATAPVDTTGTPAVVAELGREQSTAYINTTRFSGPVFRATPGTPRVSVYIGQADGTQTNPVRQVQAVFQPGPPEAMTGIPDPYAVGWKPPAASDTDAEYAAYCQACASPDGTRTGMEWDLWRFNLCDPNTALGKAGLAKGYWWCARWGGRDSGTDQSPGYPTRDWQGLPYPSVPDPFTQPNAAAKYEDPLFLATATSLPLGPGEITEADLQAGCICHALGVAVIYPIKGHVWPAQRDDGWASADHAIKEGDRVRLPAGFDCEHRGLTMIGVLVCRAERDYGWVVWDKAGALALRAEPAVLQDPLWGGLHAYQQLQRYPFTSSVLLKPGG